jgi:hypothetical protein
MPSVVNEANLFQLSFDTINYLFPPKSENPSFDPFGVPFNLLRGGYFCSKGKKTKKG